MKFTKTAVAVAIAGIASMPLVASADTTLSGIIELQLSGDDSDDVAGTSPGDPTVTTGDVLFGIVSEHELNSGLTGYGSLRLDLDRLSNGGDRAANPTAGEDPVKTLGSADSVYVGIKGGFGDFRLGEIPLSVEYGQVANDIYDVGDEINGGMSYTGTFGPVGLIANFSPENNSDAVGLGAKFSYAGFGIGVGFEDRGAEGVNANADSASNYAVGATYAIGGASLAAHYWSQEDAGGGTVAGAASDLEGFAVMGGYAFGGVSAKVTYATKEDSVSNNGGADENSIRLDLLYGLGGGTQISTRITAKTDDAVGGQDLTEWRIQLDKSF